MSNTYSYVYIGFEPTDKIILIYFKGKRIKNFCPIFNTRKGYWASAGSGILHHTITNERLARRGYYDISEAYKSMHSI